MLTCIGLKFKGRELRKVLADIFGMSIDTRDRVIDLFLLAVDISSHDDLSINLLPVTYDKKIKLVNQWHS